VTALNVAYGSVTHALQQAPLAYSFLPNSSDGIVVRNFHFSFSTQPPIRTLSDYLALNLFHFSAHQSSDGSAGKLSNPSTPRTPMLTSEIAFPRIAGLAKEARDKNP